ncbi:PQQ-dependent sugar dehydrogenase [Paracoccus sp. SY]|uniref:PQQ-dependent sugar dehydrogenase n=1 Tax=Paracoccus sp. SY TaxID=1330255 RepID=UPI000CD08507|nr:PQQ-dependent sugar dehydrogenase [Paracoccus sp. SY]
MTEPPEGCEDFGYFCRPSIGPSSIAWYDGPVADLQGRLLSTALKHGSIYAFDPAAGEGFTRYYLGQNRLRDIEIADDGQTIYLLTDSQGGIQNEQGEGAEGLENPGAILVYTARGETPAADGASAASETEPAATEAGSEAGSDQPASDPEAAEQEVESGEAEGSSRTAPEGGN